jgi:tetratricopeptide (TPR) repeat protein
MGADASVIRTRADLVSALSGLRTRAARGRGLRQVSLALLAREAGVPRSTLHTYVTGATLPPADVLDRIVVALGGTPGEQSRWAEAWDRVSAGEHEPRLARPEPFVTPAQLPRATDLWGREPELRALDELLLPPRKSPLVVVVGAAGVGKSALVARWGHRARDRFPGGQLYADLGGAAGPGVVLARFLRALGVPPPRIPHDDAEASALYRSVLASQNLLCVLDNAAGHAQVRPLLPAAAGCAVLVTSRHRLDGLVALDGAHRVTLDVLAEPDAVALLAAAAERDDEPAALAALARQCGRLPLALRITAAQLARRPGRSIAGHLSELSGRTALDAFTVDGSSPVRAAHDLSYRTLDRATRRTFRLLGLVPGPDVTAPAAAALTGAPAGTVAGHLDRLAAAHLLREHAPGRYRLHELLRRYAAERAGTDDTGPEREAAVRALLRHYLRHADAASERLYPFAMRVPRPRLAGAFPDDDAARAWLDTELPNVAAAVRHAHATGQHLLTWQLVDALRGHCRLGRLPEGAELARLALEAAEAAGDLDARAAAHNNLAATHAVRHDFAPAIAHFRTARRLFRALGSRRGEIAALENLANLALTTGDVTGAAAALAATVPLGHTPGHPGLQHQGVLHEYRGRLDEAIEVQQQALTAHRSACALLLLARATARAGRYEAARPTAEAALAEARRCGDSCTETHAHALLALIHAGTGDLERAVPAAEAAVRQAPDAAEPTAETASHTALATVRCLTGDYEAALRHAEHALGVCRRAGTRFEECEALIARGRAHCGTGDHRRAHQSLRSAVDLARDRGFDGLAEETSALSRRLGIRLTA